MTRVQKVLNWVNQVRYIMGLEPIKRLPKGDIGQPLSCPIGRALNGQVRVADEDLQVPIVVKFGHENLSASVKLKKPHVVDEFIDKFDDGKYPRLVK